MSAQNLFPKTRTKLHFYRKYKLYKIIYYFILQMVWGFFNIMAINSFRLMAPVFCFICWRHSTFLRCERLQVNMLISLQHTMFVLCLFSLQRASFFSLHLQDTGFHWSLAFLHSAEDAFSCILLFSSLAVAALSFLHHSSTLPPKLLWSPNV